MNYAKLIDHTILKADATDQEVSKVCQEAKTFEFKSVCVNSGFVKKVAAELKGSGVLVCSVVGFPLGAMTIQAKAFETKEAIEAGADEIDMVINISKLKDKDDKYVLNDIKAVVDAAKGKNVKVILETCLLNAEEKVRACQIAVKAGAHFVKTSTGFSTAGATEDDIRLMRQTVGPNLGVKASGGVRSLEDLEKMVKAGATRIGTSSGVKIIQGLKSNSNY